MQLYPWMMAGLIEFISFENYKSKLFEKQYRYTQKSLEEIEKEMLAVVARYEGR